MSAAKRAAMTQTAAAKAAGPARRTIGFDSENNGGGPSARNDGWQMAMACSCHACVTGKLSFRVVEKCVVSVI
jgi:DNA-binding XRE family transcriptional regulator